MDNKIVFGIMCILFNALGVPCFMQGNVKAGVIRIILDVVLSFVFIGVVFAIINGIMGIILGVKVLTMSDEEYAANKGNFWKGLPSGAPKAEAE